MPERPTARPSTFPFGIDWSEHRSPHRTKVGIVMRTRDRPLLLPRALDSVVGQTFDDWHLVVVNHGGDPAPVEAAVDAVAGRARGKIEILHLEDGGGMERASNAGVARLDAELIALHDDDDTWLPAFLERTVAFLDAAGHETYGGVVTHIVQRWERIEGDAVDHVVDNELNTSETFVDAQRLLGWNRFLPIAFLFRSALLDVVGPFNEHLHVIGDWDFHLRVAAVTDIGMVTEVLARYHLRADGSDEDYQNTITAAVSHHLETDARVRAAVLRRYLDADPSRLGLLVALSHDDEMARRLGERVREVVETIDWRTHHTGNRINDMHDRVIGMDERFARFERVLDDVVRRLDVLEGRAVEIRADTARIRRAFALLGSPIRPLRLARHRWRMRRR